MAVNPTKGIESPIKPLPPSSPYNQGTQQRELKVNIGSSLGTYSTTLNPTKGIER